MKPIIVLDLLLAVLTVAIAVTVFMVDHARTPLVIFLFLILIADVLAIRATVRGPVR